MGSQHLYGSSQLSVSLVLGDLTPASGTRGMLHTSRQNIHARKMVFPQSRKLGVVVLISALGTVALKASLDHIAGP